MNIKELIEQLIEIASAHGDDLPIYVDDPDFLSAIAINSAEFEPSKEYPHAWAEARILGKKGYTLPDKVLLK